MKQERITVAGPLVKVSICSRASRGEPPKVRAEKRKLSSAAQQLMNAKTSWQKLELKLAANFLPGDLVVTLTYDDDHLPKDRKAAKARLKKFRETMAATRKRRRKTFRAVYATEHLHSSGQADQDGRWHHHVVINATGDDYKDIRSAWPYGTNVEIHRLELNEDRGYESLARYMAKERAETQRAHVWGCTRNCAGAETENFAVPDDTVITVPEGAIHVRCETKRTEFGSFEVYSWIACSRETLEKLYRKRRRKR